MSLTEKAYNERKWGPFPALRQVLEDKRIKDPDGRYFGLTSASDNLFDQIDRIVKIAILVEENKKNIVDCAKLQRYDEFLEDIERLENGLKYFRNFIDKRIEKVANTLRIC